MDKRNFNTLIRIILGVFVLVSVVVLIFSIVLKVFESRVSSHEGRINVLILGKGGEDHSGGDLTDTIMLASVSLKESRVDIISIPRDIWITEIRAKINSAYYWGNQKEEFGGGIFFAKKNIEAITGIPVNYAYVLDFSSFKEIVDALGGITVNVDNSFTDNLYPIEGRENDLCEGDEEFKCRYETINFEKGEVLMNGETALKFVRSRNGDNNENTDIAREVRQQKVISAIKNEILSEKVILNPIRTIKLWNVAKKYIETDMDFYATMVLAKRLLEIDGGITSSTIPEELLLNPPKLQKYDYQYVFIPKSGSWDEIKNWVKETFKN